MTPQQQEALQRLPAVGVLLNEPDVQEWIDRTSRPAVVSALQDAVDALRRHVLAGGELDEVGPAAVLDAAERLLMVRSAQSLRRVINATGIVLHTGLGRAPLADVAIEAIAETAGSYCNVEYDIQTARRGKRQRHVTKLLCDLTGAEAATVVNNNAAATLLILATLAADREVVVSRGQLVEIGGSYRLPAIMKASGAVLREVGTTNRTRVGDYAAAIGDQTAVLMRVHTSNYRIVGFTEDTPIEGIVELAHRFRFVRGRRSGERRPVRPDRDRPAGRAGGARVDRGRSRSGLLLGRQAAGRTAMRDHLRPEGTGAAD